LYHSKDGDNLIHHDEKQRSLLARETYQLVEMVVYSNKPKPMSSSSSSDSDSGFFFSAFFSSAAATGAAAPETKMTR